MTTNYQRVLDAELAKLAAAKARPRLLLHACCAPCSSYTLEYLAAYFDITVLFYNPNIAPLRSMTSARRNLRGTSPRRPAARA